MNATEYGTRKAVETALAAVKANPTQENRNNLNHHAQEFLRLNPAALAAGKKFIEDTKASGQNIDIGIKAIEAALAAALAEERSDDSQQRVVGNSGGRE